MKALDHVSTETNVNKKKPIGFIISCIVMFHCVWLNIKNILKEKTQSEEDKCWSFIFFPLIIKSRSKDLWARLSFFLYLFFMLNIKIQVLKKKWVNQEAKIIKRSIIPARFCVCALLILLPWASRYFIIIYFLYEYLFKEFK